MRVERSGTVRCLSLEGLFAIIRQPSDRKIVMGEGKLLGGRRFMECVTQAEVLLRYADGVYVFFPKHQWKDLTRAQRDENEALLRRRRLGLLLIRSKGGHDVVEEAPASDQIVPSARC